MGHGLTADVVWHKEPGMVGQYEQHGAAFTHCWHTCTLAEPWYEYGQTQTGVGVLVGDFVGGPDVGAKVG